MKNNKSPSTVSVILLSLALKRVLAAWARGDYPGDFGEHEAVKEARRVLDTAGSFHQ